METLTVDANTDEIADGLSRALAEFRPEVCKKIDGGYHVAVTLRGGDAQIVQILSALQHHVNSRADGPARVRLSGRTYTLHAEPNGSSRGDAASPPRRSYSSAPANRFDRVRTDHA